MFRFFRFLTGVFALIGLIAVVGAVAGGFLVASYLDRTPELPERMVLVHDFAGELQEHSGDGDLFELMSGSEPSIRDVTDALDRAARDSRVEGFIASVGGAALNLGQAQELRSAIQRFRDSGRFAYVFADSFGELGPAEVPYYLAAGFDDVWLQPMGSVSLTGLHTEVPFARRALDELDIEADLFQRGEYKTAPNSAIETGFTEPHLDMMLDLINGLSDQIVAGIASGRGMSRDAVWQAINDGPLLAGEALEIGLIDRIGHRGPFIDRALSDAGSGAEQVDLLDYPDSAGRPDDEGPGVALIFADGAIVRGGSGPADLLGPRIAGAGTIAEAFESAIEDDTIEAIVFRVNSPGGSAVAAETVRHMVVRAQDAGKPVIVSMGNQAASGGYWVAANADRIIAQPGTMTGSIGVFGGKLVTDGLWDRLGVDWQGVYRGENARIWSSRHPYSESERTRMNALFDAIYDGFKERVAEGRDMSASAVEAAAKGRVWTGEQAYEIGLIDGLGGLHTALEAARSEIGLEADDAITVRPIPDSPGLWDQVTDLLSGAPASGLAGRHDELAMAGRLLVEIRPLIDELSVLMAEPGDRIVRAPHLDTIR